MTPLVSLDPIILNILLGLISFGLAFGIKVNHDSIKTLEARINSFHEMYAKKSDTDRDFKLIMEALKRIEDKLEKKVDR